MKQNKFSINTRPFLPLRKACILLAGGGLLLSCNRASGPEKAAEAFLEAYLSTDYQQAASCCTERLSEKLLDSVKDLEQLEEGIKQQITGYTRGLSTRIDEVTRKGNGDTVLVSYTLFKASPDSQLSSPENGVRSSLSLVKDQTGWKVAALNKL